MPEIGEWIQKKASGDHRAALGNTDETPPSSPCHHATHADACMRAYTYACVHAYVRACLRVRACVRALVLASVRARACVRACACVHTAVVWMGCSGQVC